MFDCFQSSDAEKAPTKSAVVLEHHLLVDTDEHGVKTNVMHKGTEKVYIILKLIIYLLNNNTM